METINHMLGIGVEKLTMWQMLFRTFIIFFSSLAFIRIAGQRTLGTQNVFDQLTLLISGAILGRSIVSAEQPFFPSLAAVLLLMLFHRLLAVLTYKSKKMGKIFKGEDVLLVKDGQLHKDSMARCCVTIEDVHEAMRLIGNINQLDDVKEARLERAGEISIVRAKN